VGLLRRSALGVARRSRLIFFRGGMGLFATALVALRRMSLRSLQAPCRRDWPVFAFSSGLLAPKHSRSLAMAIDAAAVSLRQRRRGDAIQRWIRA
jgi:hypothetical protein